MSRIGLHARKILFCLLGYYYYPSAMQAIWLKAWPFVRYQTCEQWTRYVLENEWTDCDANWHKWFTGQGYKTSNFRGQEVKGHGYCHAPDCQEVT